MATPKPKRGPTSTRKQKPKGESVELPVLGAPGDECEECAAPLAADQRYCLNCGHRRTGPRVDYGQHRQGNGPDSQLTAPAGAVAAQAKPRDWGAWPAVFGIAVLGGMLLIGVLIGKEGNNQQTAASQPVVIQGGEATTPTSTTASTDKNAGDDKGKTADAGSQPVDVGNAHVASEEEISALDNCSGEECKDIVDSLGNEIATPGEAPPTDNKAPGGGSGSGTVIK